MVEIPAPEVGLADLAQWYQLREQLAKVKQAEALLRGRIFHHYFPDPKEGTNDYKLNDGTGAVLKATYPILRSVDIGSFEGLRQQQQTPGTNVPNINLGLLIKMTPEVVISEYRKLTEEERNFFDQCLIIKPGSPSMEVKIPKRVTS